MVDPTRRPYVVQHLSQHEEADSKIQGWMDEYVVMQNNLPKILESGELGVSIATNRKDLDILKTIQEAGISAKGMKTKANFALIDLEMAILAVRNAL